MRVVVRFYVRKEFGLGVFRIDERSALKHLRFELPNERLCPGVVVGVGLCGHALKDSGFRELASKELAAILTAPITVKNEAGPGAA